MCSKAFIGKVRLRPIVRSGAVKPMVDSGPTSMLMVPMRVWPPEEI